jgi:hypothetical protein
MELNKKTRWMGRPAFTPRSLRRGGRGAGGTQANSIDSNA